MSLLIGKEVSVTEKPPAPGVDIGTAFVIGQTDRGRHDIANHVRSMAEYELVLGPRSGGLSMYDWAETFFEEGGTHLIVGRVVGATPVKATGNIFDQSGSVNPGDVALVATAKSVGAWGNSLNVAVEAGDVATDFRIHVTHDTDTTVDEISPSLADRDAAVAWATNVSRYIDLALGASNEDPRVQAGVSLATGTDDSGTIDDTRRTAALNVLLRDLGPGHVAAPGVTTTAVHTLLLAHAKANNRFALLDLANVSSVGTLATASLAVRALADRKYGKVFGLWAKIPGVAGGTYRTVPYSAVEAGLFARSLGNGKSSNDPPAGENGICRYVVDLAQVFSDTDFNSLLSAGANIARVVYNTIRTYGDRTAVDPFTEQLWLEASDLRMLMEIRGKAEIILEAYVERKIDSKRHIFSELHGELKGMLVPYLEDLFGYAIDVDSVNTTATINARQINAAIDVQIAPAAEKVRLNISKSAIS